MFSVPVAGSAGRPMVPTARHKTNTITARIISDSLGADYTPLQDFASKPKVRFSTLNRRYKK
jgi:hypothetical protein